MFTKRLSISAGDEFERAFEPFSRSFGLAS